jgi:hypothetical protein
MRGGADPYLAYVMDVDEGRLEATMSRWMGVLLTCAWILWAQGVGVTRIVDAYETKRACDSELQGMRERQAKLPQEQRGFVFVCLPDTVDPSQQIR